MATWAIPKDPLRVIIAGGGIDNALAPFVTCGCVKSNVSEQTAADNTNYSAVASKMPLPAVSDRSKDH